MNEGLIFKIRQILNIIFMVGALVGVVMYFVSDNKFLATIIILVAMAFKMMEYVFRFMRPKK